MPGTMEARNCELCGFAAHCREARMPDDSQLWLCVGGRNDCFGKVKRLTDENNAQPEWRHVGAAFHYPWDMGEMEDRW